MTVSFFDNTYDEALKLTQEARDYLQLQQSGQGEGGSPEQRLLASCEAMRLTSRMTQIIAWLLIQKAVHVGEITRDEARQEPYRLAGHDVCDTEEIAFDGEVPPRLRGLLDRSYSLYRRVARLDAMHDSPVH